MHLSEKTYEVLKRVLDILELEETEKRERIEKFEQLLVTRFTQSLVTKLPPHEREGVVGLANEGVENSNKAEGLKKKLDEWLNQKEIKGLFEKTAHNLFDEYLREQYQKATAGQKKKLEELLTPEALGI